MEVRAKNNLLTVGWKSSTKFINVFDILLQSKGLASYFDNCAG
jgi:hypothetical protein